MIRFARSLGVVALALVTLGLPSRLAATSTLVTGGLPLYFEARNGPTAQPAQFIARGPDCQFLIASNGAQIALRKPAGQAAVVRMQFPGANPQPLLQGDAELPGKLNYLTGNDPAQWHTGVPMFAKVRVNGLYPGINLVYYGNQHWLEYDFTIAPGADPAAIALRFDGANQISITPQGELALNLAGGEIRQPRPVIYQIVNGARQEIAGGYRLVDAHTVAFVVGRYDHQQPLVIDPVLSYSTYFGGTSGETAWAVALDTNGIVYFAGQTFSQKFFTNGWSGGPAFSTFGAVQTNFAGGKLTGDAFVAKFSTVSNYLFYLTYLGGNDDDVATCLAVDKAGNAFVSGYTDSSNFPVTADAIQGKIGGAFRPTFNSYAVDAFVTELDASGSNLVYSTYFGGSGVDGAYGIAVDDADDAYFTGFTTSSNFPVTGNAMFKHLLCTNSVYYNANAFLTKIGPGGSNLLYSTYFGGTNFDTGRGIAVDRSNFVYVAGFTDSTNFPITNAIQTHLDGITNKNYNFVRAHDAFVAKFDPTGTNLIYSTFLGSTNDDEANGIAVDGNGAAYVTGWTTSTNFPNTLGTNVPGLTSFLVTNRTGFLATNVFLAKITNGPQAGLAWSTVFGGRGAEVGNAVALDPAGEVFVTGSASSPSNFPAVNVPAFMSRTNATRMLPGQSDAFVIAFNTNATALLYSGYLGGRGYNQLGGANDYGYGIAADASGNAYVVGQTYSTNFPTVNAPISFRNGTNDAFIAEILLTVPPPQIVTQPASQSAQTASTVQFSVQVSGNAPFSYQWLMNGTNLVDGTNAVTKEIITGATNASTTSTYYTLTIRNAQPNDSGNYSVIVTNYGGAVTSSIATLTITNIPPAITLQPTNQTVGAGTTAKFAVTATGTAPVSYQWQFNGTNLADVKGHISGVTSNLLTISNVQLTNSGIYTAVVTNSAGSATSSNAVLTVQAAPVILTQPDGRTNAVGATAAFAVTAAGMLPLHYQWQKDGVNLANLSGRISGVSSNVLTLSNAQTTNSGNYSVIITNSAGSVASSNAPLLITNIPPAILVQPADRTVGVGSNVTFAVTAAGTAPLHYQWQFNGTNLMNGGQILGATTNLLTINNVQLTNNGAYTVVVSNPGGSVTSSNALLTAVLAPVITQQPTNLSLAVGTNAALVVAAVGQAPLHYQWQKDGNPISGATSNVLAFAYAQTNNSGTYSVIVTNLAGSVTSSNALLLVTNMPPTITLQPTNRAVVAGGQVKFVVAATGTLPLSYQWQFNGVNLTNSGAGGQISGATSPTLTLNLVQTTNSGNYQVVITNPGGSATSSNVTLTVATSPVILVQPTNAAVAVSSNATFVVTAIGNAPLSYQWWLDETNLINGATNSALTVTNAQLADNGNEYTVVVSNSLASVTSSNAFLTVTNIPATITAQPASQTVAAGSTAQFTVGAIGTPPLGYQWWEGTNLLTGATNDVLTFTNAQAGDSGTYFVTVSNVAAVATSSNAVLTVTTLSFANIAAAPSGDGGFVLSGSGGTNNGTYYVLAATNLLVPLTNWTYTATGHFDGSGNFIFTNTAPTNAPQEFYRLQLAP